MLAKNQRLNLRFEPDYKNQFSRLSSQFHTLLFKKDPESLTQVAFLISKRTSNKAVVRNRLKRQLSSYIQNNWTILPQSLKLIIIPKGYLESNTETEHDLRKILGRLG